VPNASLAELRAVTYKPRDAWWTVLLTDPVAIRIVRLALPYRWITPNLVTVVSFLVGLVAATCFLAGGTGWLIVGALIYQLSFVLDCVDGKIARWHRSGSILGGWLDFTLDQVRMLVCMVALFGGAFLRTQQGWYLVVGMVAVFLAMFRYFNGFLIDRARLDMSGATSDGMPSIGDEDGIGPGATTGVFGWLNRHRIRGNIFSGIEFQMVILVLAPLTTFVLTGAILACAAMVLFELAHSYRFIRAHARFVAARAVSVPDQRTEAPSSSHAPR
jgi:phosphatidylglycerophosphate synthase